MLKNLILSAALILSTLIATPANTEEQFPICRGNQLNFTPFMPHLELAEAPSAESKSAQEAKEEVERLAACERMKQADSTPFSFYGYRHAEAHCNNWVKQLQSTTGIGCCSSAYQGECRVTEYDFITKRVKLDGAWCPVVKDTKWGVISISPGLVLACAMAVGKDANGKPICPAVHCVGRGGGA